MSDIKIQNSTLIGSNIVAAQANNESAEQKNDTAKAPLEMSKGEKIYNWGIYSGLNYWTNLIGSIWLADKVINGSWRKPFDRVVGMTAKAVESTGVTKSLSVAHHNSKVALETLALTGGGWLLLIPMKWLEDRKRPVVHWLNERLGVDQTAPDGRELTASEIYIEKEQPRQGWMRVIGRRMLATLAVVSSGTILDKGLADKTKTVKTEYAINPYDKNSEIVTHESYLGGKKRVTDWIVNDVVGKGVALFPKGEKAVDKMKHNWVGRWVELAALDTFFTKLTAIVMFVTRGAKKEKMPEEIASSNQVEPKAAFEPINDEPVRKFAHTVTPRKEFSTERFVSHAQKLAAEPDQQLQPNR